MIDHINDIKLYYCFFIYVEKTKKNSEYNYLNDIDTIKYDKRWVKLVFTE